MWNRFGKVIWNWRGVIGIVICTSFVIIALRMFGWLQPLEWNALDIMFQLRPQEAVDSRITIISIQETDIQQLKQWPISDRILAKLIQQVETQKPIAIGLSLYRDLPIAPGYEELVTVLENTPTLIGITKAIEDSFSAKVNPPPILAKLGQISASDLIVDGDGVVRRAFLYPVVTETAMIPSLGMAVALKYLEQEDFFPTIARKEGSLQLNEVIFPAFEQNDGGYIRADDSGYQILLNFRGSAQNFPTVSLMDVLKGNFNPELFQNRIVLIGSQATSAKDHFYTPYSQGKITNPILTSSVEIQANLASQILSTVLDRRSSIKVWSDYQEYLGIFSFSMVIAILGWKYRQTKNALKLVAIIIAGEAIAIIVLLGISYCAFLIGWWLPLIPSLLSSFCVTILIITYINVIKLQEYNTVLKAEVKARTYKLEAALVELHSAQSKIIFQEKLASLGTLVAGVSHELKNPLHFIVNFADLSVNLTKEIREEMTKYLLTSSPKEVNSTYENLDTLVENLVEIQAYSNRANDILKTMLPNPNQQSFDYVQSDIHQLINSAINLVLHNQHNSKRNFSVSIIKDYDQTIDLIEIIPQNISRALINIIDNAYYSLREKYYQNNEKFNPTLKIRTSNFHDKIAISIQDNGQGIPQEIIHKVFDPFFTTKPPREGMGLGLSIALNLITENSQGKIELKTKANCFTKLTILLFKEGSVAKT
ncbi:MAG: CHASE2 domain-containing protein [Waterburya sp.]